MTLPMTNDIGLLLERLRGAKGPDRALSAAIHHALLGEDTPYFDTLHSTASIDAAWALVERMLGGRRGEPLMYHRCSEWSAHALEPEAFTVRLSVAFGDGSDMRLETFEASGPSEPLATIAALLSALKEVR